MDWTVILSVIVGLSLFRLLQGFVLLVFGLVKMKTQKVGEIDTTKPRGSFYDN